MSSTIAYLTSRADFMQVSSDIPVTKKRNAEKVDSAEVFAGAFRPSTPGLGSSALWLTSVSICGWVLCGWMDVVCTANKKELVADMMMKAKQVEYLIQSLPAPESEEEQVEFHIPSHPPLPHAYSIACD